MISPQGVLLTPVCWLNNGHSGLMRNGTAHSNNIPVCSLAESEVFLTLGISTFTKCEQFC